jgi:hypothetical protein
MIVLVQDSIFLVKHEYLKKIEKSFFDYSNYFVYP